MDKTEKIVLKSVSESLRKSLHAGGSDWADYAKKMKTTIETVLSLIEALTADDETSKNQEEENQK